MGAPEGPNRVKLQAFSAYKANAPQKNKSEKFLAANFLSRWLPTGSRQAWRWVEGVEISASNKSDFRNAPSYAEGQIQLSSPEFIEFGICSQIMKLCRVSRTL